MQIAMKEPPPRGRCTPRLSCIGRRAWVTGHAARREVSPDAPRACARGRVARERSEAIQEKVREVRGSLRAQETSTLLEAEPEEEDQGARCQEEGSEATRAGETLQRLRPRGMAVRDRSDVVEVVRAAADLREIVSDYIPLKK